MLIRLGWPLKGTLNRGAAGHAVCVKNIQVMLHAQTHAPVLPLAGVPAAANGATHACTHTHTDTNTQFVNTSQPSKQPDNCVNLI